MGGVEKYHAEELGRLKRAGDWAGLVQHFMGFGGYEPALEAALELLKVPGIANGMGGRLTEVLKAWQDPERWGGAGELLEGLREAREKNAILMLHSFSMGALVEYLSNRLGSEHAAGMLEQLLRVIPMGRRVAEAEGCLGVAAVLSSVMAIGFSAMGQRREAAVAAQEAVEYQGRLTQKNREAFLPDLAMSLNNLANMLSELGRREEALEKAALAVKYYEELPIAVQKAVSDQRAKAHRTLAMIHRTPDVAGHRNLREAYTSLIQSVECAEMFRSQFKDEGQRQRVLAESLISYELLIQTAVELWEIERDLEPLHQALHAAEGIRQRSLLDRLRAEVVEPDAPEEIRKEWREWFERLESAEQAILTFELGKGDEGNAGASRGGESSTAGDPWTKRVSKTDTSVRENQRRELSRQREDAERKHQEVLQKIRQTDPEFDPYEPIPRANVGQAGRMLSSLPGTLFVEYVICREGGYALVMEGEQIHPVKMEGLTTKRVIEIAQEWMEGYPGGGMSQEGMVEQLRNWGQGLESKLRKLAPEVLWPVMEVIRRIERQGGKESGTIGALPASVPEHPAVACDANG